MKNWKIILSVLFILLAFFLFFKLDRADLSSDDGHYAFRALHYFDYLASDRQTTPIQWFGYRPWWSLLSFHDHPPVYFLIQHLFFLIFGATIYVSRLTSALSAIGTAIFLYLIAKRRMGERAALFSLGALVLNNYFIWMGRIGLLEGLMVFWAILGIYFLDRASEDEKYFLAAGVAFGLAFMTKLSFVFIAFGLAGYYFKDLRSKRFWMSLALFAVVISPYFIYNFEVYLSRGHFDVQLTGLLLGSKAMVKDWPILSVRGGGNILLNALGTVSVLADGFSLPYFILLSISALYLLYLRFKKREPADMLGLAVLFSIFFCFSLIGAESSWLGIASPFAALIIGDALSRIKASAAAITVCLSALAIYQVYYIINTNLLTEPLGSGIFGVSSMRIENQGYRQLDEWINSVLSKVKPSDLTKAVVDTVWYKNIDPRATDFPDSGSNSKPDWNGAVVYDIKTNWFSDIWTFLRWKFYEKFLILTSEEFVNGASTATGLAVMKQNIDDVYFVEAAPDIESSSGVISRWTPTATAVFVNNKVVPEIIRDDHGEPAFYIYHARMKDILNKPIDFASDLRKK